MEGDASVYQQLELRRVPMSSPTYKTMHQPAVSHPCCPSVSLSDKPAHSTMTNRELAEIRRPRLVRFCSRMRPRSARSTLGSTTQTAVRQAGTAARGGAAPDPGGARLFPRPCACALGLAPGQAAAHTVALLREEGVQAFCVRDLPGQPAFTDLENGVCGMLSTRNE